MANIILSMLALVFFIYLLVVGIGGKRDLKNLSGDWRKHALIPCYLCGTFGSLRSMVIKKPLFVGHTLASVFHCDACGETFEL